MTFSYSGDPSTGARDELRFLVQDVDENLQLLSNEELDYLLNKWLPMFDSVTFVAAIAAQSISRKFAGVTTVSADGVTVQIGDLSERYATVAQRLRDEYRTQNTAGVMLNLDNIMVGASLDPGIAPLRFGVGLHDNPAAGQQDYGGQQLAPSYDYDTGRWT